jgi:hypothetical protein
VTVSAGVDVGGTFKGEAAPRWFITISGRRRSQIRGRPCRNAMRCRSEDRRATASVHSRTPRDHLDGLCRWCLLQDVEGTALQRRSYVES